MPEALSGDRFDTPFTGPNYIAVEGVIGVGKTSFAEALAERIGAALELDEGYQNPFLEDFYRNRERYAFPAQLFFLLNRFQRQQALRTPDLFAERIVADYIFARDALFASVTLTDRELKLYEKILPILERDIPRPDLVIYLQASPPALLERIRKRDHKLERHIDREYLDRLCEAYNYYFFNYTDTPLLVVKTDHIDFVREPAHLDDIVDQLQKPIHGKRYYSPPPGAELDYGEK
ncbi:MAG TPA: deoxynucleoside kinase [candidate division Zixibacteria bacterium]|nr:deoxynucleoside kinase [candidate division Zixibacteria bacterium]